MQSRLNTTDFLGLRFVDATYAEVAEELDRLTHEDGMSLVVTANVDHVVMLLGEPPVDPYRDRFAEAYRAASLRLCDSRVLQALARFRGIRLPVVTGSDLTELLFRSGRLDGRKVALVGGDPKMFAELKARFPRIDLFQHIPPMGIMENEPGIVAIEQFLASEQWHYVLFAMGAPRSEIIARRIMTIDGMAGVALCVGASIEFLLGRKARAPQWVQKARLEWAFRLLSEPRRLWRRYLVKGPRILTIVRNWKP